MLNSHKASIENDAENDEQVKHRLGDDGKADLLHPQPADHETPTTAVETTFAVTIHQLSILPYNQLSSAFFH